MAHFAPHLAPPLTPILSRRFLLGLAVLGALIVLTGCSKPTIVNGDAVINLDGTDFTLTIVADNKTRERGLGGVTSLPKNGGMIFVFPDSKLRSFVMRDCLMDIDIIFLDSTSRIIAMHHMPTEESQKPEESPRQYESRLKKYTSRYNAMFAIEIAGGLLETMSLKEGQLLNFDAESFKSLVQ